jgi:GT2 family glycosyltransferase
MVTTDNSKKYTDLAIDSFFRNTDIKETDKFYLIDNDNKYQLTQYTDKITKISNNNPKTFAENMNLVMKLAAIDGADFFGLSNDVVFTENWNQNFTTNNKILVPLCNQKFIGEYGSLKIESAMDLEDYDGKEQELNTFVKLIDFNTVNIDKNIIGFYCFYIPHQILSRVGFLDENFKNGGEDIDYRLRAQQLGFDVDINCDSYLLHFYGKSIWRSGEEKEKTLEREKNYREYFAKKWGKDVAERVLVRSSVS